MQQSYTPCSGKHEQRRLLVKSSHSAVDALKLQIASSERDGSAHRTAVNRAVRRVRARWARAVHSKQRWWTGEGMEPARYWCCLPSSLHLQMRSWCGHGCSNRNLKVGRAWMRKAWLGKGAECRWLRHPASRGERQPPCRRRGAVIGTARRRSLPQHSSQEHSSHEPPARPGTRARCCCAV